MTLKKNVFCTIIAIKFKITLEREAEQLSCQESKSRRVRAHRHTLKKRRSVFLYNSNCLSSYKVTHRANELKIK